MIFTPKYCSSEISFLNLFARDKVTDILNSEYRGDGWSIYNTAVIISN